MKNIKRWLKRQSIHAIDDDTLVSFLIKNGKISSKEDTVQCDGCKKIVTAQEIAALSIGDNNIQIACQNIRCLEAMEDNKSNE